jgi:hypothetical protein
MLLLFAEMLVSSNDNCTTNALSWQPQICELGLVSQRNEGRYQGFFILRYPVGRSIVIGSGSL